MVLIGFLLWALFFIVLAFSMMPGYMSFVGVVSIIGGVLIAVARDRERRSKRPAFKLGRMDREF